MKDIVSMCIVWLLLSTSARAEMQEISGMASWATYGGINDDGKFTCAMVTETPDGSGGKLVIEKSNGAEIFLVRILKPTWTIAKGARKSVYLQFGYGRVWKLWAIGSGIELRAPISLQDLNAFLAGFQSAGRIDLTFVGGTEPPWQLATGGGGIVEPDFIKCIRMSLPNIRTAPTQP